jgi:hypothetical protein
MGAIVLRKSIGIAIVAVLALAGLAAAETVPFDINGELRVRNENDNRDFVSDTGFKSFNLMRTRLGIDVTPVQDMKVFLQVQDSRLYGDVNTSSTPGVQEDVHLDLHQGFFQVDNLGWQGFGLKAGRMEERWANERLISPTDWNNVPTAFDGGQVSISRERASVAAMWAKLVERDTPTVGSPDTENSDRSLIGGVATVGVNEFASVDAQVINVRDAVTTSADDDVMLTTIGGRVFGSVQSRWDYSLEGAWQTGTQEIGPAAQVDLGGWMLGSEVGVTFGSEERPVRFGVGYDHLSGDDATSTDKVESFNTLFGDNHRYYGVMDIVTPVSIDNPSGMAAGVRDIKVNAKARVWSNTDNVVTFGGEFHNFSAAETAAGSSSGIGNEVDVHATWAYRERFVPTLGFSAFLPGDAPPTTVVDPDNSYWVYLQGVVSF